jgi:galactokinase
MTTPRETAVAAFRNHFNADPAFVARAPGRVNLIGEHTDYNDGFVLPLAIDRATWIALRPRADRTVWVHSLNLEETAVFSLDQFDHADDWSEYLRGMAWVLQDAGYALSGWEGMLISDVPIGAGLSSSAALEMAVARAFQVVSGWEWAPARMAQLCKRADNQWVGIQSGIMDQMISASGQAGQALLIDCRTLETQPAPLPPDTAVVILDTNTRRGLVDSAYNERRAQCAAAAAFFGVPALRDVDLAQFAARAAGLDDLKRRRARHVITENARTLEAVAAMRRGDAAALGALMDASHASLRDDFDVSSAALNAIVACARRQPACYGARMTGAGFGGCAVALVDAAAVKAFSAAVDPCYRAATGQAPTLYACRPAAGAAVEAFGLSC